MKLAIMTKSTFFVEEDKILSALFDEGLDDLHLFKPASSPMFSERLLTLLPEEHRKHVTVHEHFYLKEEYDLAAIHLDNTAVTVPTGYKGKVSRTCDDLLRLKEMKKQSRYVFLKNIYDCIEFPEERATFSREQLEEASSQRLIDRHVYALGGITVDNIRQAADLGFGGVVVCGDLWNRFDIHSQTDYKDIISHFHRLRKAAG